MTDFSKAPLDCSYFIDSGLLFELNRQFLHPLGIALTIRKDEQGRLSWGFKDARAAPETLVFDAATLRSGRARFETFLQQFGFAQMDRRSAALGAATQHVETWVKGKRDREDSRRKTPPARVPKGQSAQ